MHRKEMSYYTLIIYLWVVCKIITVYTNSEIWFISFGKLYLTTDLIAESAANCLLDWIFTLGVAVTRISNKGPHSKSALMLMIDKIPHAQWPLKSRLYPHPTQTIEVHFEDVLWELRALLLVLSFELNESIPEFPALQGILNHSPSPSTIGRSPITVFSGLPAGNGIGTVLRERTSQSFYLLEFNIHLAA